VFFIENTFRNQSVIRGGSQEEMQTGSDLIEQYYCCMVSKAIALVKVSREMILFQTN